MNTSKLQAFATDARRQLMNAVQARLDAALVPNSDAQVDDPRAFAFLQREIERAGGGEEGRRHVVERYAYRWFNRIIAFRYMDVHGFTGTPVVSPAGLTSTNGLPEVLAAAKRGEYDSRVFSAHVNDKAKERIEGLLSGSILADDPQGRAYGLLLQSECRFWNRNLPFMFENVGKEAGRVDELLMPADLLAEGSVLRNAVEVMTPEDCGVDDPSGNVEIIGWLYQYYISERKNEVMDGFKKNHKAGADEIPAATQLFTPDWIVRYLVQNTVGRLWMQSHPDSQLYKNWDYYIQPSEDGSTENEDILNIQAHGLARRLRHTHAQKLVLGVSGGLDSTLALLVMARAFDRMGMPRDQIHCVTMPCFGTTDRTYQNACKLSRCLGAKLTEVNIKEAVNVHFRDIGHDPDIHDVTYENSQARERTQILMDTANKEGGVLVGTGDLSELALGWATYNGDHMSMYGVNASVPKTLVRHLVRYYADTCGDEELKEVLLDILDTPVSPELLPPKDGKIAQKTEDLVGPYELHDFYLYYMLRAGFTPDKIYRLACLTFDGIYDKETILKWLKTFYRRFFAQQFKRSCLPDGPKVGSVALSPRGDLRMPSDASARIWQDVLEKIEI